MAIVDGGGATAASSRGPKARGGHTKCALQVCLDLDHPRAPPWARAHPPSRGAPPRRREPTAPERPEAREEAAAPRQRHRTRPRPRETREAGPGSGGETRAGPGRGRISVRVLTRRCVRWPTKRGLGTPKLRVISAWDLFDPTTSRLHSEKQPPAQDPRHVVRCGPSRSCKCSPRPPQRRPTQRLTVHAFGSLNEPLTSTWDLDEALVPTHSEPSDDTALARARGRATPSTSVQMP